MSDTSVLSWRMPLFVDDLPPRALPGEPAWEVLVWRDAVHEHNESCVLSFWRLSFGTDYQRDAILAKLGILYADLNVTAHIAYETLGDFDLLLRLWIPRSYIPEEVENRLRDLLRENSLWDVNYLVGRTQAHWAWMQAAPANRPIVVGDALITSINAFNDKQIKGTAVSRPVGSEALIADGVLMPIPLRTRGIRVYITFDRPSRALTLKARDDALEQIKTTCADITEGWVRNHPANSREDPDTADPQISIYSGTGTMTTFFIMARAPHRYFHEFIRGLVIGLRATSLGSVYQMRPNTYVLADRMFSEFTEHRLSVESGDFSEAMLNDSESESLELKSTFSVNLRRYRADGQRVKDPKVTDQVVKAICGLLNSRDGGTLVIGVLEVEREFVKVGVDGTDLLAWLGRTFNYVPTRGPAGAPLANAVIGVAFEYLDGGPFSDADTYQRAIHDVLKEHIEPEPWPWLRMALRSVADTNVVVISVRPADTWCYAKVSSAADLQFFVREAASTRAYSGHEADLYKNANPR